MLRVKKAFDLFDQMFLILSICIYVNSEILTNVRFYGKIYIN